MLMLIISYEPLSWKMHALPVICEVVFRFAHLRLLIPVVCFRELLDFSGLVYQGCHVEESLALNCPTISYVLLIICPHFDAFDPKVKSKIMIIICVAKHSAICADHCTAVLR